MSLGLDQECESDVSRITKAQIAMMNGGMSYVETLPFVNELLFAASERYCRRSSRLARAWYALRNWWFA